MNATDDGKTTLHARCGPCLVRLAALAESPPGAPLPSGAAQEVAEATEAVLARAEEAVSGSAAGRQMATAEFLTARITRLKAAAGCAVIAARSGDVITLRACLRQFDALNSALWEVYEALAVPSQTARAVWLSTSRTGPAHVSRAAS